ncbi:flagellar motor stator protein MotA [Bdellovibrio bacteriovorus]|uniref:Flagellar motor stator protein MotA n=3 Tax=Bdellovibrio bacteriovorus TaxID=959 RepID=A0A1Z3N593_BDEBC|nr:flagellar motor stator protein MotA [Bdellovibrio bacteriovorus]AHZ83632.1 flagellar motor protein MotA [Bdellovibrio bacteriovorus]ASD62633.1 flagellar motor stator protein MotA [Bdellovibrio bacteriovorus]BEV69602.1 Chemotaxis protein LafT [Bdellovibrio bacteriovorus]
MGFVGILVVFVMVFGGFLIAGGNMSVIIKAAPLELMIIGGAALGAYIIANPMKVIKAGFKMSIKAMTAKGPQKQDYVELLQMMFQLFQAFRKEGPQGIEKHIEEPDKSDIFKAYPSFMHNHHAVHFLCDTMKITLSAEMSPYDVDDLLDADIKAIHHEEHMAVHAVQTVADGFPGLGIVAAVLGIVKTMAHLTDGVEKIGALVASALVGTMLGVFGAYGLIGPTATKMGADIDAEGRYLGCIKAAMVALQRGAPPIVCVEYARRSIMPEERPSFEEVDKATKEIKKAA